MKKWIEEDGQYSFKEEIYVPFIDKRFNTWIEGETDLREPSEKQLAAIEVILGFKELQLRELKSKLRLAVEQLINDKVIKVNLPDNILDLFKWEHCFMCVPTLYDSEDTYVFILPESKELLIDGEFELELEILFNSTGVVLVQEMTGLWNRVEWFTDYCKVSPFKEED